MKPQNQDCVKVVRGPYAGKRGKVIDLLPEGYMVLIGRKSVWFTRAGDLELTKAWSPKI